MLLTDDMRLLIFIYQIHFVRHAMILPLIPLFAQSMGYSGTMIGAAVSAFSLLSLLASLPLGNLSDRLNARSLILIGTLFNFTYSALLMLTGNIWMLVLAQLIGGLGHMFTSIPSQTWISKHAERKMRERGFGLLNLAAAIGQTIGPFLGGFVLSHTSFRTVFSLAAFISLPGFSIAALRDDPQQKQELKEQPINPISKALVELSADRKMLAALIFTFAAIFTTGLRNSFVPVLLKAQGREAMVIGLLLSVFALSTTLVRLVIGRVMGIISRGSLLSLVLTLLFISVITLPSVMTIWLSGGIMFLFGMGFGISQPLSMVMVSDRAGKNSGMAMGTRFFVVNLALLISPVLTGIVVQWFNIAGAFYFVAGFVLTTAVLIRFLSRSKT